MKDATKATVGTIEELVRQLDANELEALAKVACEKGDRRTAQRISCLLRLKELS
jgi:hypothetical protein